MPTARTPELPNLTSLWTRRNLALMLAGLVLGLSLAVHWEGKALPPADARVARERAAQAVRELEAEQEQLKAIIARLRDEVAAAQRQGVRNTDLTARIGAELEREQVMAGLTRITGPGVIVQLDDSKSSTAPGTPADSYIVHEYDLRDVVNLLWIAGAEAVSVNDERLVNTTSIYCVGSTIMVNDTRLSPPYVIRGIVDRRRIEPLLDSPAYLANLRHRVKAYGVQFRVSWPATVEVPAYSGTFRVRYAQTGEVQP